MSPQRLGQARPGDTGWPWGCGHQLLGWQSLVHGGRGPGGARSVGRSAFRVALGRWGLPTSRGVRGTARAPEGAGWSHVLRVMRLLWTPTAVGVEGRLGGTGRATGSDPQPSPRRPQEGPRARLPAQLVGCSPPPWPDPPPLSSDTSLFPHDPTCPLGPSCSPQSGPQTRVRSCHFPAHSPQV